MENEMLAELKRMTHLLEVALPGSAKAGYDPAISPFPCKEPRMANLTSTKTGARIVRFKDKSGRRRTLRLGKLPLDKAEEVRAKIADLVCASTAGTAIAEETTLWLTKIDDRMAERLAGVGLIPERAPGTLGGFIAYLLTKYADAKPRTRINLTQAANRMLDHFGADQRMSGITSDMAEEWVRELRKTLSPATVSRAIKYGKQVFHAARRAKLITESPFAMIKAGSMANPERMFFVEEEDAARILDACPSAEWRVIFALARWGGLRCPSELVALRWSDIDLNRGRVVIRAHKTEEREFPLFPELRHELEELRRLNGGEYVVGRQRHHETNLRTMLEKIIVRAGLLPWPKPFQNLRSTRETELVRQGYPVHVVAYWLGNSAAVAARHYLQVTDSDFERALQPRSSALPKARQQDTLKMRGNKGESREMQGLTRPTGFETPIKLLHFPSVGSQSAPDLNQIIAAWPHLPEHIRAAIAALAGKEGERGAA